MNQSNPYMKQGTPYQKYGYDNFEKSPQAVTPQKKGMVEKVFGQGIVMKFKNPLFATAALLLAGSAFAVIIAVSYPGDSSMQDVPVIKAEKIAFKEVPSTSGGMEIPFQESTIFTAVRDGKLDESAPVENLLDQEKPADRFAGFSKEAEKALSEDAPAMDIAAQDAAEGLAGVAETSEEAPFEIQKIVQKTEKISGQDIAEATAMAISAEQARPPHKLHAPGSSPETLAFVRSVLDKKDSRGVADSSTAAVESLANIQPAAGAALGAGIAPGNYFVQLASVTSSAGAQSEWGSLQKKFAAQLTNVSHRVQQADLGERGTYYRIQAGPMSKDSASTMCDAIKAQKPGGCLVVK